MKLNRRHFIGMTAATASLSFLGTPSLQAASPTDPRLVFIFLRGGLDGLGAVPTPNDADYKKLRPTLAMSASETLPLDDVFALHPSLVNFERLYSDGQATVFHGIASPNRDRSHFDAIRQLEQGSESLDSITDGWLGRASTLLYPGEEAASIALSNSVPLSLLGADNVVNWAPSKLPPAPSAFLDVLETLYEGDSQLKNALLAGRSADDIAASSDSGGAMSGGSNNMMGGAVAAPGSPAGLAASAGLFLSQDDGPRIAMLDIGSYDTHQNEAADLNGRLKELDDSFAALEANLGDAWKHTSIFAVSEFGRTVAENGTRGTDHGTGGVAFLAGGAVSGGSIKANWQGLSDEALFENRDLVPAFDVRSVMKAILIDHMHMNQNQVQNDIFPDSEEAVKMEGLFLS